MSAVKSKRPKVAREVLHLWHVHDPPGCFLAHKDDSHKSCGSVKAKGTIWFDVGDKKAREKAYEYLQRPIKDMFPSI